METLYYSQSTHPETRFLAVKRIFIKISRGGVKKLKRDLITTDSSDNRSPRPQNACNT